MATRQELYTAIGLIRQTCRLNRHSLGLTSLMEYDGPYNQDTFLDFDDQKDKTQLLCTNMNNQSFAIITVLEKADPNFLDSGLDAIPVTANRQKIVSDSHDIRDMTLTASPAISLANSNIILATLAEPFKAYLSECGIEEPDPWTIISLENNYANILHDILDAMSYELQGKDSYTGESLILSQGAFEKLIDNRISTAYIYLNRLSVNEDVDNMGSIAHYIRNNFGKLSSNQLGQYIDINLEKQIIVRRWWAL